MANTYPRQTSNPLVTFLRLSAFQTLSHLTPYFRMVREASQLQQVTVTRTGKRLNTEAKYTGLFVNA